jgi:hypothetical protein
LAQEDQSPHRHGGLDDHDFANESESESESATHHDDYDDDAPCGDKHEHVSRKSLERTRRTAGMREEKQAGQDMERSEGREGGKGGGRQGEDGLLASAYRQSLMLARDFGIKSLAFPSISTGIYGFPIERAAKIALGTISSFLADSPGTFSEVRMVLFSPDDLKVYQDALELLDQ